MSQQKSAASLAQELRHPDPARRVAALAALEHAPEALDGEVLEAVIEGLASEIKGIQRRAAGVIATAGAGNPMVVTRLRALLEAPSAAARWAAAYALGLIDGALDLRACQPLFEAMAKADGDVRWAALELVVKLGRRHPDVIRGRLLAMLRHGDPNSRKMSLYALRNLALRDPAILAAVRGASLADDGQVRLAALSFIKELGVRDEDAVDSALERLGSDLDPGVRRAAASTLGYLKDRSERVVAALREAADAPHDPSLRKAARQTLDKLKEEP
jgi:HEAT repeat protein